MPTAPAGKAIAFPEGVLARLGFVASVLSEGITASRTCRLRNADASRLREITAANVDALMRVLTFLDRHDIRLYRISSNLIPYASHAVNTVPWWQEQAPALRAIGARLRRLGIRVSTHPGQYTVLNSPHPPIVRAAVAELEYHARLLDALGCDTSSKIVIHVGGLYGMARADALARFRATVETLSGAVRRRLVVENDDRLFDAATVLQLARDTGLPMVFDWLHDRANPSPVRAEDLLEQVFDTWGPDDGRPKVHMSSQAPDAPPGAHADDVRVSDMLAFLRMAPGAFDCMLEAKRKDLAVLRLRRNLARRGVRETDLAVPA